MTTRNYKTIANNYLNNVLKNTHDIELYHCFFKDDRAAYNLFEVTGIGEIGFKFKYKFDYIGILHEGENVQEFINSLDEPEDWSNVTPNDVKIVTYDNHTLILFCSQKLKDVIKDFKICHNL